MASRVNSGAQRVLAKLESRVNAGEYYEAHQMYRTLYFRYLGQQRYPELLQLLYDGSVLLLQHKQYTSGADLGILYVDVLTKSGTEFSGLDGLFEKLGVLFALMSPTSPERETFAQNALRWSVVAKEPNSAAGPVYKTGHPTLHQKLALVFWREKNYQQARQHFMHSKDGSGCAAMLVELHQQKGYTNEIDLFIAQAVLQYLCLQNKVTAHEVFDWYTSRHPKIKKGGPPFYLPLLNFLFFLLKTIDTGTLAIFTVLCEQYRISLNRDPCYRQYLDKIGQLFFNVPPPRPQSHGGLFGSILETLFNEFDCDDDDERRGARPAAAASASTSSHTVQDLD